MAGGNKHLRGDQASIKYCWNTVKQSPSELASFAREEYASTLSSSTDNRWGKGSDSKTPEILSMGELFSAAGRIWDYASCPLTSLENEVNSSPNDSGNKSELIFGDLDREENGAVPTSARVNYLYADLRTVSEAPKVQPILDFVEVTQKISATGPFSENHTFSSFWRLLQAGAKKHKEPWRQQGLASVELSYELENIYGWMKQISFAGLSNPIKASEIENRSNEYITSGDTISTADGYISGNTTIPANKLAAVCADSNASSSKPCYLSSFKDAKSDKYIRSFLYSNYFLRAFLEEDSSISRTGFSNLYAGTNSLVSHSAALEESELINDDNQVLDTKRKEPEKLVSEDSLQKGVTSSASQKPHFTLAKQEHAFAGAFAGIFVSLCLHPVDTVKTVVQSCSAGQKSVFWIGRSIVSDRGLTGLYRGITTSIASSAPISAIYTFTYESVKGSLLPFFPKEYYSLAHCVAGGCASIATSFVFTPSERIKQQMQVGTHYNNCWNAFIGIIEKGGLRSLYNGWGAVLCRNVPHSIIKFYTYESLKQLTLSSLPSGTQPNTLQTLFCGGLAGTTAAFFTTPFDVVKTRLQTQIPGSASQYGSVIHVLYEIGKHEGLNGLYRGLAPRLVMYMSQGALFFASYEFLKKLYYLEMPQPETEIIQNQQNMDDHTVILTSSSSSTLPSSETSSLSSVSVPQKLYSLRS
ncbi:adenine nucleotide transporter BT1, chloroplastic/mitochondrial [Humulus lupulus]|uniref:adenine nucleotide transporter BT1, chloroplastic/mitochondrial n=1 Tax=Humulus lupulus TaxID=3486 RepID=UPI002B408DD7|nr:adenine nucleotide transporter BT1, chloroplastic/mitochondrial [Humulus lupulus]XP_062074319.1 adenine nucleotide transporter BT1, chloroplastic/mitochondrial [Humulus lupulus]XP_062074320.1 adenine nucleotide transporter BT1, chloroplastic/mitochondrial [Humulus lupulus]XP_062074321.1 adenine nucleotide transporter BT1, chloroplastic/mitochondrial [Humulus lupulus]